MQPQIIFFFCFAMHKYARNTMSEIPRLWAYFLLCLCLLKSNALTILTVSVLADYPHLYQSHIYHIFNME